MNIITFKKIIKAFHRKVTADCASNLDTHTQRFIELLDLKDAFFADFQKDGYDKMTREHKKISDFLHDNFNKDIASMTYNELDKYATQLDIVDELNSNVRCYFSINLTSYN